MTDSSSVIFTSERIPPPPLDSPVESRVDFVVREAKEFADERVDEYEAVLASIPAEALPEYLKPLDSRVSDASVRKLPDSGQISLGQIGEEGGIAANAKTAINDAACRDLIGKASESGMSFSEWYGASAEPPRPTPIFTGTNVRMPASGQGEWGDTMHSNDVFGQAGDLVVSAGISLGQRYRPDAFDGMSVGNLHSKILFEQGLDADRSKRHFVGYDHAGSPHGSARCYQNAAPYIARASLGRSVVFSSPVAGVRYKLVLAGNTSGSGTETHTVAGACGWIATNALLSSRPNPRPPMVPDGWIDFGSIERAAGGSMDAYYEHLVGLLEPVDTIRVSWPTGSSSKRTICAIVQQ